MLYYNIFTAQIRFNEPQFPKKLYDYYLFADMMLAQINLHCLCHVMVFSESSTNTLNGKHVRWERGAKGIDRDHEHRCKACL